MLEMVELSGQSKVPTMDWHGQVLADFLTVYPDRVAAQDILQETNLVICRKFAEFEPGSNFKVCLHRHRRFGDVSHWTCVALSIRSYRNSRHQRLHE